MSGRLWAMRVQVPDDTLDLTFDSAVRVGLDAQDLVGTDYERCQEFAERWRAEEANPRAILVPSAALPGTRNLVIFGARVLIPFAWEPIDADVDVPTCIVADGAQPPNNLPEVVCYRDQVHGGLAAWQMGMSFSTREPKIPAWD